MLYHVLSNCIFRPLPLQDTIHERSPASPQASSNRICALGPAIVITSLHEITYKRLMRAPIPLVVGRFNKNLHAHTARRYQHNTALTFEIENNTLFCSIPTTTLKHQTPFVVFNCGYILPFSNDLWSPAIPHPKCVHTACTCQRAGGSQSSFRTVPLRVRVCVPLCFGGWFESFVFFVFFFVFLLLFWTATRHDCIRLHWTLQAMIYATLQ